LSEVAASRSEAAAQSKDPYPSHMFKATSRSAIPPREYRHAFSSQSAVIAITDFAPARCNNDIGIGPAKPDSQYSLINRMIQRVKVEVEEENPPKPPQNGNLARKSDLTPYSGRSYK